MLHARDFPSRLATALALALAVTLVLLPGCVRDNGAQRPKADLHQLRNLARLHAERQDEEGYLAAAMQLEQAVTIAPRSFEDRLNLAKSLLFTRRSEEARAVVAAAAGLAPKDVSSADLPYVSGILANRRGDRAAAITHFARVTELRPRLLHGWYQLGSAFEKSAQFEEARAAYAHALEVAPENRAATYRMVVVLRQLGREAEADRLFERFNTLPQAGQPDTEKCDLTSVRRVPVDRKTSDPPEVVLKWREVPDGRGLGAVNGAHALTSITAHEDGSLSLAYIASDLLRCVRLRAGAGTVEAAPAGLFADTDRVLSGDIDNDGHGDLILLGASAQVSFGGADGIWSAPIPISVPRAFSDAQLFDADHDGDLDLVIFGADGPRIVRHNGDRSFSLLAPFEGVLGVPGGSFGAHDLDQGNDLDFVFPGQAGAVLCLNRRDGGFATHTLGSFAGRTLIRLEDFDNDGAPDLFAAGGGPGAQLARNGNREPAPGEISFEAEALIGGDFVARDVACADLDNDADLDIALATEKGVIVLRNRGGRFRADPVLTMPGGRAAIAIGALDLDDDGRLELLAEADGGVYVFEAEARPAYPSWVLRAEGRRDNHDATGAVVEQFAGAMYQSQMARGPLGIRFGLGPAGRSALDGIRVRWPQGIIQAVPSANLVFETERRANLFQEDGLVASCPFLYGRGPEGWRFLTDVIGIAPLDEWLPPGVEPALDPEEYVRIEASALAEVEDELRLCLTEELRETTYLDRLELHMVEHPAGTFVFADEGTNHGAYEPLALFLIEERDLAPPATAVFEGGLDATELVSARDAQYAHGYPPAPSQWGGWVARHDLLLTTPDSAALLLLTGRIHWYDSTVSYNITQHGRTWGPLQLLSDGDPGARRVLHPDLGLPAGMDRTMVARIAGAPLPANSRVRLSAHHRFLWDRVLFATRAETARLPEAGGDILLSDGRSLVTRILPLRSAELHWRGYSKLVGDKARHEQRYEFTEAGPRDEFHPATGLATRYGEVRELALEHDDQVIVIVAGDAVEIGFEAPPPPAEGSLRTYFLRISGWAKEGSYHNRTGAFIEPLPFRAMRAYPPAPEDRPGDAAYADYLARYQTREVRGLYTHRSEIVQADAGADADAR